MKKRMPLMVLAVLVLVLLYLLAISTGNTSVLAHYYWWVFGFNSLLLLGLMSLVVYQWLTLRRKVKTRVFGAKLTQRMVTMFAIVALVPGILIFTISAQFLTRSIESWFNVRVENALDQGLELGRNALSYVLSDLGRKAKVVANDIDAQPDNLILPSLDRLRVQLGVDAIQVLDTKGTVLSLSEEEQTPAPKLHWPNLKELQQLPIRQPLTSLETTNKGIYLKVVLPFYAGLKDQRHYLYLWQPAPETIAKDANLIEVARSEYRQLLLARDGLKTFYILTLVLVFLLAMTSALSFALYLSERMSAPLSELAAGARAVAQGDYSKRHPIYRRDELGMLTALFNRMTQQLDEARQAAQESHLQLQNSKLYLESILANLTAGVIAFDLDWHLRAANTGAEKILGVDFSELAPFGLNDWPSYEPILQDFVQIIHSQALKDRDWQQQLEFTRRNSTRTLLLRGASLPGEQNRGYVVVFDDVTDLATAQRDAAWGEVARRLAHEIRNPLTPIQLSAERLAMKLSSKLEENDANMLKRATDTIINQVAALKGMVEAFRDYARAPKTKLVPLALNQVIWDVLALYEGSVEVKTQLAGQTLMINGDAALLRQVFHNILINAQDAVLDVVMPMIQIITRIEGGLACVEVRDNGMGFAPDILNRAFEPYVTSKAKGTGLGLAVVKKIVEEHHGQVTLSNIEPHGASILITLPLLEV